MSERYIQIDEEGYFHFDGTRVTDEDYGAELFRHLRADGTGRCQCQIDGVDAWVEAFDEPLVARNVESHDGLWEMILPYGQSETFRLETLTLDEWDRFHGHSDRGLPFVLSRGAQAEFFQLLSDYDDETITADGKTYSIPSWLNPEPGTRQSAFWDKIYQTEDPGWELNQPHPALPAFFAKLKLARSRILVLGAGSGNDAAFFASQGHIVTAVDFSAEAISRAQAKYGSLADLKFMQADAFQLPDSMYGQFDLVFEHTFYCAVDPIRRNDIIKLWRRLLVDRGHLLGIFFVYDKPKGPPFGGSEWELRKRLQNAFNPLYWMRVKNSPPKRLAREALIYAQKSSRV
ncbi:MAG: TPMT family class I SAM-dependent methyltransferase [Bdellovibrionaceae bacterium]|nr:TPMT family class I SAM-dependent methyltransferase [Pseudobdellovibrionaceae bacterium]